MTTEAVSLELDPRAVLGKKVKQLRRQGITPVHLYGPGVESRALQCESGALIRALSRAGGNRPISVTIQGERGTHLTFAREIQWDPKKDSITHVDFMVAQANRPMSAQVPIVLTGESQAARMSGGTVMQGLYSVDVEALPLEMPAELEVDLSVLTEPDQTIRAGDIALPPNVTLLSDPEEVVVRIEAPRELEEVAETEAEAEEEAEAEAAEEGAGGEQEERE